MRAAHLLAMRATHLLSARVSMLRQEGGYSGYVCNKYHFHNRVCTMMVVIFNSVGSIHVSENVYIKVCLYEIVCGVKLHVQCAKLIVIIWIHSEKTTSFTQPHVTPHT